MLDETIKIIIIGHAPAIIPWSLAMLIVGWCINSVVLVID